MSPQKGDGEKQMIIDDMNDDATMPAGDADGEEGGESTETEESSDQV